jgi:hypothetical protein
MLISEERLFPCVMGQLFGLTLDEDEVVERIQDPIVFLLGFQALREYVHFQSRYLYSNTSMSCSRCLQFQLPFAGSCRKVNVIAVRAEPPRPVSTKLIQPWGVFVVRVSYAEAVVRGEEVGRHVTSGLGHVSCEKSPISAFQPLRACPLDITCLSTCLHSPSRHRKVHPSTKEHVNARTPVGPTTKNQIRHDHAVNLTIPMV